MVPLRIIYHDLYMTFTYISKVTKFETLTISKTDGENKQQL